MKECGLYECYEPVIENSAFCQYHQPIKREKASK